MNRMLRGAAVATALLTLAGTAQAQGVSPISFGVAGGISMPTGDYGDVAKSGYHGEVMMGIHLPAMPLSFRIEGMYAKNDGKDLFEGMSQRILGGTGNVLFDIPAAGPTKFYLIGGGGVYNLKVDDVDESTTKFGLNGGAGVRFQLAGISPFVEARYHSVFTDGSHLNMIPVSVGISFR